MAYTSLTLRQFRSYHNQLVTFKPGVNIIVGPNGSGKTNMLEALYVIARGKSFRVADIDLLQRGTTWLRIQATVDDHVRELSIKHSDEHTEKQWRINGAQKSRLSEHERLHVVLFEPRDMQLLTGSPERRREFLDDILEQLEPKYASMLSRYRRALLQRNMLLKQFAHPPDDQIFVWNVRVSELGAYIIAKRRQLVTDLSKGASTMYARISSAKTPVTVHYDEKTLAVPDDLLGSTLLQLLEQNQQRDQQRGFTSIGPHRDDVAVILNGASASTSASRGETRSLVVMLKLLEAQLLQSRYHRLPLVLLDDVFGELDATRRKALASHFTDHQVVITSTDADDIASEATHIIRL